MRCDVRIRWRLELPQWALIALMILVGAIAWSGSPAQIPVHWNLQGQVDRYGGRFEGLLLLPLITVAVYLLLLLLPHVDPRRTSYAAFAGAYASIRVAVVVVLAGVYVVTLAPMWGLAVDVGLGVSTLVGALLVLLGIVLPRVRPNWFVGIRTPWTLSSQESWRRTHALGRPVFIVMGVCVFATGLTRAQWAFVAMMAAIIVGIALLFVYSYVVWRADRPNPTPGSSRPL
jgi:uncharacterized membrane protein